MNTTIGVSQANLTNQSTADTNAHNYYITRFVSPLIYETGIQAKTWTYEFGAKEANTNANFPVSGTAKVLRVNCYVWKPSDGTKVGTILDGDGAADYEEAGTTQSVINGTFSGAAVTGLIPGDAVIVFEMWAVVTQAMGTQYQQDVYYDGTTENSTSSEAAFISTPQDIILTPTGGSETIVSGGGSIASTANTTEYWSIVGRPTSTTTEAEVKYKVPVSGTLSYLTINLGGNGITGTTTFTLRKNGADTGLTVSSAVSGQQIIEDLTHTVTVAAGDDIDLKTVPGGATGTFTIDNISMNFKTDTGDSCQIMGSSRATSVTAAGTTRYMPLSGDLTNDTVEAEAKVRQKKAGFYKHLMVYVSANARTTDTTFKTRKNGANGNITITVPGGQTGVFTNTTSTDTVAVDDDFNFAMSTGTGTENITFNLMGVSFFADDQSGFLESGNLNTNVLAANLTRYQSVGGNSGNYFTNEPDTKRRSRLTRMTVVGMQVYLVQNSVTANSTLTLRKNGADANNTITITASTTGLFQDNAHTDEIYSGDEINYKVITGATGTQIEVSNITIFYKLPRVTKLSKYLYDIVGRISKENKFLYDIIGRISKEAKHLYDIFIRVSKENKFLYDIEEGLARVSKEIIFLYDMIGRITKENKFLYDIIGRISKELTSLYDIFQRVSKEVKFLYDIAARISKELTSLYDIIGRVSKDNKFLYDIVGRISKELTSLYDIFGRISKENKFLYDIIERVSKEVKFLYDIFELGLERISKECKFLYDIFGRISKENKFLYDIFGRISKEVKFLYDIFSRISKDAKFLYDIFGRISKEGTFLYDIFARISKQATFLYDIFSRVSKEGRFLYDILQLISKESRFIYDIFARASKEARFIYDIFDSSLIRVSKEISFLYDIIFYGVGGKPPGGNVFRRKYEKRRKKWDMPDWDKMLKSYSPDWRKELKKRIGY